MELYEKICKVVEEASFDALLVTGSDNFAYMAGASVPFISLYPESPVAVLWLKHGEPTVIAPEEWEDTIRPLSSIKKLKTYAGGIDAFVKAATDLLKRVKNRGRVGVDLLRVPHSTLELLRGSSSTLEFVGCDSMLRELRATKTEDEAELLEEVAYMVDHGIFGAQHHVLVTSDRSEMSLSEEVRVHCMETGLDVVGGHSVSQAASGENAAKWWPRAPYYGIGYDKKLRPGEYVRCEARYSLDGYWSAGSRLMTQGYPMAEQREAYFHLVALREKVLEGLKPGARLGDIYMAVAAEAKRRGAKLVGGLALGHGVGVTDVEAPYIAAGEDMKVAEDMFIVIRPVIEGPRGELLWSSDTVVVESGGPRVVGWYKDWREPYVANYTL